MRTPVGTGRETAFSSKSTGLALIDSSLCSGDGACVFSIASMRARSSASSRRSSRSPLGTVAGFAGAGGGVFDSGLAAGAEAAAPGTVTGFAGTSRSSLSEAAGSGVPCARASGGRRIAATSSTGTKRKDLNTIEFQGEKKRTQVTQTLGVSGRPFGKTSKKTVLNIGAERVAERTEREKRGYGSVHAPARSGQVPGKLGSVAC